MADDAIIERCAQLCDEMIRELEGLKPRSRKGQYDRQSPRQIDYAVRAIRRLSERQRALKGVAQEASQMENDAGKLAKAITIARELRPVISRAPNSAWKQNMLQMLDDVIR